MNFRDIVDKLDPEEWLIPESFLETNQEFLQILVDKVEEELISTNYKINYESKNKER